MANFQDANWDLAVIYSGNNTSFSCPDCVHVELNKGAKWLLVYSFTQSTAWQNEYQHRYNMVYVPDDDILQTTATINSVFDIHAHYGLLISQPVLCSWLESHTASWDMVKGPTTVLRYSNFVEIMVPLFSMSVFNSTVISTMSHAETGVLNAVHDKVTTASLPVLPNTAAFAAVKHQSLIPLPVMSVVICVQHT